MKKTLLILTVLLQMIGLIVVSGAADAPTVTLSSVKAKPGETVTIDVAIANNPGIAVFDVSLKYDADALSLEKVEKDAAFPGNLNPAATIPWFSMEETAYNGKIFTVTMKVLDTAKAGTVSVSLDNCEFKNWNEEDVNFTIVPGSVTVEAKEHVHSWDAGKVTTAATCKEAGEKLFTCSKCGETRKEVIPVDKTNHADYGTELKNAKPATKTEKGYTGDKVCKGCGTVLEKGKEIPIPDPVHTHTLTKTSAKDATCTASGNVEYYTCSGCKKTFSDATGTKEITDVTVPAKGHQYGEWKVEKEATKTAEGLKSRVCKNCGDKQTQSIPKLKDGDKIYDIGDNNNGYPYVGGSKCDDKEKTTEKCAETTTAKSQPTGKTTANTGAKTIKTDGGKTTGDNGILLIVTGIVAVAGAAFAVTRRKKEN